MKKRRRAFILIELIVVIAIVGILVVLLLRAVQAERLMPRSNTEMRLCELPSHTRLSSQLNRPLKLAITQSHPPFI
ncbi:MAG: type II secretion system protein [Planctomycetota bacterium]|jgi:prepilin-type N-terminal cleavage/methylation domain-containing protein